MINFILAFFVAFNAHADSIPLLPGLYELDMKMYMDGKLFDPMAELKKQMAANPQMAQMMAGMNQKGMGLTSFCLKKEDIQSNVEALFKKVDQKEDNNCKHTITSQNQKQITGKITCKNGDGGDFTINFLSSKKYEMDMKGKFNGKPNVQMKTKAQQIKSQC